jgi:hypothetical protein
MGYVSIQKINMKTTNRKGRKECAKVAEEMSTQPTQLRIPLCTLEIALVLVKEIKNICINHKSILLLTIRLN